MTDQTVSSEYLKIAEAARFLGVTQRWVYRRIASGELPASKVGGLYFIRRADLQGLLEQGRVTPTNEPAALAEPAAIRQKCGYCYRIIESDVQIGEVCKEDGCPEIICTQCAVEGSHHCARHSPTRDQRWEEAQELYRQKKIPVLVKSMHARLLEINFINRIQERLARFTILIHPLTSEVINLPNWDSILEQGDERVEVMRLLGKVVLETSLKSALPFNPWLRYRLPVGKGRKGPPLEIQVRLLSRLPNMLRDGFDTQPFTIDDLLPWVPLKYCCWRPSPAGTPPLARW
jgi:excisionase family DNA binding protein